ncbi:MAG TPA: choice-of-anchor tandem repeat GloVer-containing protein [Candidatus Sulfotelmatobacter sp.]|nr:choice-of-anchor tandem repeat GloVer-containing protein [Candidatus Sulfotelmatobacter sp.]
MTSPYQLWTSLLRVSVRARIFLAAPLCLLTLAVTQSSQAQTYTVLHNFTGGQDGGNPYAGVTLDGAGNLYGTTTTNNNGGPGSIYKLTHRSGGWTFATLYDVGGFGAVSVGPNGTLYGINNYDAVFNLQPPPHFLPNLLATWIETTLYANPAGSYSGVVFDRAGNIYGTTYDGGSYGGGTVYELSPSNGGWTASVIYSFGDGADGQFPIAGLLLDASGNLYGTTEQGGAYGYGTVYELSYSAGSGWTESFLYSFTGAADGGNPYGGLIFDRSGNLYGATPGPYVASQTGGTVFKLTPSAGSWTLSTIYSFPAGGDECGPRGTPAMDAAGNLYDTTTCLGAHSYGSVFKLTPINGGWTYTSLHDFGIGNDGAYPEAGVTLDANGHIYGTTSVGGADGDTGIVFEITP